MFCNKSTFSKPLPEKANSPIVSTLAKSNFTSLEQLKKHSKDMPHWAFQITDESSLQYLNVPKPIFSILYGRITSVNPLYINASFPIAAILSKLNVESFKQYAKHSSGISH